MTDVDTVSTTANPQIDDDVESVTPAPEPAADEQEDGPALGFVEVRHPAAGQMEGRAGRVYNFAAHMPVKMSRYDFAGLIGQEQIEARVMSDAGDVIVDWCPIVPNWKELLEHTRRD